MLVDGGWVVFTEFGKLESGEDTAAGLREDMITGNVSRPWLIFWQLRQARPCRGGRMGKSICTRTLSSGLHTRLDHQPLGRPWVYRHLRGDQGVDACLWTWEGRGPLLDRAGEEACDEVSKGVRGAGPIEVSTGVNLFISLLRLISDAMTCIRMDIQMKKIQPLRSVVHQ